MSWPPEIGFVLHISPSGAPGRPAELGSSRTFDPSEIGFVCTTAHRLLTTDYRLLGSFCTIAPRLFVGWAFLRQAQGRLSLDAFPGGNWLCFARSVPPVPARRAANWVRFARLAPRIGFVCTTGLRRPDVVGRRAGVPPQACPQSAIQRLALFCTISPRERRSPDRHMARNWVCLYSWPLRPVSRRPEIGFVLHIWLTRLGLFLPLTTDYRLPTTDCYLWYCDKSHEKSSGQQSR